MLSYPRHETDLSPIVGAGQRQSDRLPGAVLGSVASLHSVTIPGEISASSLKCIVCYLQLLVAQLDGLWGQDEHLVTRRHGDPPSQSQQLGVLD